MIKNKRSLMTELNRLHRAVAKEKQELLRIADELELPQGSLPKKIVKASNNKFQLGQILVKAIMRRVVQTGTWSTLDSSNVSELLVSSHCRVVTLAEHMKAWASAAGNATAAQSIARVNRRLSPLDKSICSTVQISPTKLKIAERKSRAPYRGEVVWFTTQRMKCRGFGK